MIEVHSYTQEDLLLDGMNDHPDLTRGNPSSAHTRRAAEHLEVGLRGGEAEMKIRIKISTQSGLKHSLC